MCHCVPVTAEEVSKIFGDFISLGNETDQQTHVMSGSDFIASFPVNLILFVCLPICPIPLREKEQVACLLLVLAEEQNITQRPGSREEAGLDHSRRAGRLRAL